MKPRKINILLADDDLDDCTFFKEAIEELEINAAISTIHDGVQLMQFLLESAAELPHVLYLDLNMPRKNGYDCLTEIKLIERLKLLPVIIYSTSFNMENVSLLYETGANYYICKPAEFANLKKIILKSLELVADLNKERPTKENFILNSLMK